MLGDSFEPLNNRQLVDGCTSFISAMYGYTSLSLNGVRYALFCAKGADSLQLPPTDDAFQQHLLRANYQSAVWRQALEATPELPSPDGHGWSVDDDGSVQIVWMTLPPAPQNVLKLFTCSCQSGCTTRRCTCFRNQQKCTEAYGR